MQKFAASAAFHATGIRIARSAGRNRQHARAAGNCDALRGGVGGLGGGGGAGEDEDDYECANDMFHEINLLGNLDLSC